MALQLPNDNPPLDERFVTSLRTAARTEMCGALGATAQRQQRKANYEGAVATFRRLLVVPGIDVDMRARTEANLAASLARLGQLADAEAAATRGVAATAVDGVAAQAGTPVVQSFAISTLAGCKEAMGDAVATGSRDPGAEAAAMYIEAKELYRTAHQICKDAQTRSAHGRVQAKAHPGIDWISDGSLPSYPGGIHSGGVAKCVTQGATIEQLPA